MKFCKTKFFSTLAVVLSLALLLNSVLFVNNAMAAHEVEKLKSNKVIMLLGQEVEICSAKAKTVTIDDYIKLFNAKHFGESGKDPVTKKGADLYYSNSPNIFLTYKLNNNQPVDAEGIALADNLFSPSNPRSPPVAA